MFVNPKEYANIICSSKIDKSDQDQRLVLQKIDILGSQASKAFELFDEGLYSTIRHFQNDLKRYVEEDRIVSRVLQSLAFENMYARQENVDEAYSRTFRWIFDDNPNATEPWSNFVKWLEVGEGMYWINGKAGSGKSTVRKL